MLPGACAVAAAGIAAAIDVRTGRIPNALVMVTALSGVTFAASGWGGGSIASSIAGLLLGGALMLPAHVMGAMGAGDVKLVAALGAVIGPRAIALTWLYTAIAGGLLACAVAVHRRRLTETVSGTARLIARQPDAGRDIRAAARNRYAYGPAILIGTIGALIELSP